MAQTQFSPLLRLPFEIRIMIYELLLFPSNTPSTGTSTSVSNLLPDYHTYYTSDTNKDMFTLAVRTIDPYMGAHSSRAWRRRSTYHVQTGPFLTSSAPTTYRILLTPHTSHLRYTIPSLLLLNRQIHTEASKILYSTYTFAFNTNIEALVPFLSDLTPRSREAIRHISLTKKALPFTKEFDRAEWSAAFSYLSSQICLQTLNLTIMAGKPTDGWEDVVAMSKADFEILSRAIKEQGSERGGVDLKWVEDLMKVRSLRSLEIKACTERCMSPRSENTRFWVAFSKSVDKGFAEWARGVMVRL